MLSYGGQCRLAFFIFILFFNFYWSICCCSVSQSCLTLRSHGLQHARLPGPSPSPRVCSNSCPSTRWCHPTISSSVIPFSSCLQSFLASGSFPMSHLFTSGGQNIGASASLLVLIGHFPQDMALKLFYRHYAKVKQI